MFATAVKNTGGLVGSTRPENGTVPNPWTMNGRVRKEQQAAIKLQSAFRAFLSRKKVLQGLELRIWDLEQELASRDIKQGESLVQKSNEECKDQTAANPKDSVLALALQLEQRTAELQGLSNEQVPERFLHKRNQVLEHIQAIKELINGTTSAKYPNNRGTAMRAIDLGNNEEDILNIGKFLNQHEEYGLSDVALAAEPMFSPALAMRNESISPVKSIWTPLTDKSIISQASALSTSQMESLFVTSNSGKSKDSATWKGTEADTLSSVTRTASPLGILEEYEIESTRLRYLSFEKSTKAHFQCLVEKIVKTNDQPASLLLQQKVKNATENIKNIIFECIMEQCLPLIRNRFGNFLMQRCLEAGTSQQVKAIVQVMKGNVYSLSCDRFGCHVVQKAMDTIDQDSKIALIQELLPFIHETILHRFACHVWQRIFEIKWSNGDPLALMQYVTSTLKGYWQRVANDENGSLVVQCIFEHCSEQDKAPVLAEIMSAVSDIAKGQWGNWVVQHILEHGTAADKQAVFAVVHQNIYQMSIDQYASKVVEKSLRAASKWELNGLINAVILPQAPNLPPFILDMMSNQYANYVVQHILNVVDPQQREVCIQLIAPHISSLKGSKYGQRVAILVERMMRSQSLAQFQWTPAMPLAASNCGTGQASHYQTRHYY